MVCILQKVKAYCVLVNKLPYKLLLGHMNMKVDVVDTYFAESKSLLCFS